MLWIVAILLASYVLLVIAEDHDDQDPECPA